MPRNEPKKQQARKDQGKGGQEAVERYNNDLERFVKSARARHAAREAVKAMDWPEGLTLRKAGKRDDPGSSVGRP